MFNLKDFLKTQNFIELVINSIEDDRFQIKTKLNEFNLYENSEISTTSDLLICIILSINNHLLFIDDMNLILKYLNNNNSSYLLDNLLKLFNFEQDPLRQFKLNEIENDNNNTNEDLIKNSILKLMNDIYSSNCLTNELFNLNDFHVIIDIIIRKLENLDTQDQIRLDYVSLIDTILRNNNYIDYYRFNDLNDCFKLILNEKIETIEQDILRKLLNDLKWSNIFK